MANQQGSKTKTNQPGSGQGTNPTSTENRQTGAIPAGGQDMNQGNAGTQQTAGQTSGIGASSTGGGQNTGGDQPIADKLQSTASGILDKAKETASGTYDAVATQATTKIEERKGEVSAGLHTLADTFRKTGTDLKSTGEPNPLTDFTAQYSGAAANKIEQVASYFERKDLKAMMRDAEGFARRNPAIFLGAAFALGMVAARFLKSSAPDNRTSMQTGGMNAGLPTALPSGNQPTNPAPRTA